MGQDDFWLILTSPSKSAGKLVQKTEKENHLPKKPYLAHNIHGCDNIPFCQFYPHILKKVPKLTA